MWSCGTVYFHLRSIVLVSTVAPCFVMLFAISRRCAARVPCYRSSLIKTFQGLRYTTTNADVANLEKDRINSEALADKEWISSTEAKSLLRRAGHPENFLPSNVMKPIDMKHYLQERHFDFQSASSYRTLSSLLTFPLTLSYGMRLVNQISHLCQAIKPLKLSSKTSILVVGARAESSLPLLWWTEALYAAPIVHSLRINFLGPGLQARKSEVEAYHWTSCADNNTSPTTPSNSVNADINPSEASKTSATIELLASRRNVQLLHTHPQCDALISEADMFVLYNPGLGATAELRQSWQPTIKKLLASGKPVLLTAHCLLDLSRDMAYLIGFQSSKEPDGSITIVGGDEIAANAAITSNGVQTAGILISPELNPFRSAKQTFDVNEELPARVVTTNHYVYAVIGLSCE